MLRCYIVYYNKDCGRYRGRNVLRTHKHTHTDKHSSDFISVQCHELQHEYIEVDGCVDAADIAEKFAAYRPTSNCVENTMIYPARRLRLILNVVKLLISMAYRMKTSNFVCL